MIEEPNSLRDSNLKKQDSLKNHRFNYIVYPALIIIFFSLVLAFQNCKSIDELNPLQRVIKDPQDSITPITSTPTTTSLSHTASKAIFSISEQQGRQISSILWQVKDFPCHGEREIVATGTNPNLEIDWDSSTDVSVEVFVQFEGQGCINYKEYKPWDPGIVCTQVYAFEDFKRDHNPWKVLATDSNDEILVGEDFSVGSSVNLEFIGEDHQWEGELNPLNFLDFTSFQWSIKKAEDQVELADQANATEGFTHAFSNIGVYNVSVTADLSGDAGTGAFSEDMHEQELYNEIQAEGSITRDSRLVIGKCEEDGVMDIEVSLK